MRSTAGFALALLASTACLSSFDLLGQDETVTQRDEKLPDPLADDRIEDKHPQYDPSLTVTETFDRCATTLNLSGAVTKLDIIPFQGPDAPFTSALYADVPAANAAMSGKEVLPSMEVVNQSLKAFNDGLYAAIELGVEDGLDGSPINKLQLLSDLVAALDARAINGSSAERPPMAEAARYVSAGLKLGGGNPPADVTGADSLIAGFDADTIHSRPIGFYTWSPKLSAIFKQDRFLQNHVPSPMSFGGHAAVGVVLAADPALSSRYGAVLDLYAGLTNPSFDLSARDLLPFTVDASVLGNLGAVRASVLAAHPGAALDGGPDTCAPALALFPSSDSPENKLLRTLSCPSGVLPSGNLLDVIVDHIRSGALDLTPTATSGFYDRQLFALQTLLVPDQAAEKDHLFLTLNYKKKLVETFKSLLIETRETHVKQVELVGIGATSATAAIEATLFDVYPKFPVEPFPTFYLRTARAYAFLSTLLQTVLGDAFMSTTGRLHEDGTRGAALASELRKKTSTLYGLHLATAASLGMRDQRVDDERAAFPDAAKDAAEFVAGWSTNADVAYDPRVIVPGVIDANAGTVTYWAVIGVRPVQSVASFYPGFLPRDVAPTPTNTSFCAFRSFVSRTRVLYSLVNVQVRARLAAPPLTREEFRAICDANKTEDAIVAAIQQR